MAMYNPAIFDVSNMEEARGIILTSEAALTSDQRWTIETPHEADIIESHILLDNSKLVLDFGCGIGRLSRSLIHRTGCRAIGMDISPNMRALSSDYVRSDRFTVTPPGMLDYLVEHGIRFDAVLAVWVLQHVLDLHEEVQRIHRALRPGGKLFVINEAYRVVPIIPGADNLMWANDGLDVRETLRTTFHKIRDGHLSADLMSHALADRSYWEIYERDA